MCWTNECRIKVGIDNLNIELHLRWAWQRPWGTVFEDDIKEDEDEEDWRGEDPSVRHGAGVWAQESDMTPLWSHTERINGRLRGI